MIRYRSLRIESISFAKIVIICEVMNVSPTNLGWESASNLRVPRTIANLKVTGFLDIEPEESGGLILRIILLELRRMESFLELFILS